MPKTRYLLAGMLLIPTLVVAASSATPAVQLTMVGDVGGATPMPEAGTWFALVPSGSGFNLVSTHLELQRVPDPCTEFTTQANASGIKESLFLVRGSPLFRSGAVDAAFHGYKYLFPAESVSCKLSSGAWFGFQAYGAAAPAVGGPRVTNYQIDMYQGRQTQTIARFSAIDGDGPPRLIRAGDLDRDNRLDAMFDSSLRPIKCSTAGDLKNTEPQRLTRE